MAAIFLLCVSFLPSKDVCSKEETTCVVSVVPKFSEDLCHQHDHCHRMPAAETCRLEDSRCPWSVTRSTIRSDQRFAQMVEGNTVTTRQVLGVLREIVSTLPHPLSDGICDDGGEPALSMRYRDHVFAKKNSGLLFTSSIACLQHPFSAECRAVVVKTCEQGCDCVDCGRSGCASGEAGSGEPGSGEPGAASPAAASRQRQPGTASPAAARPAAASPAAARPATSMVATRRALAAIRTGSTRDSNGLRVAITFSGLPTP